MVRGAGKSSRTKSKQLRGGPGASSSRKKFKRAGRPAWGAYWHRGSGEGTDKKTSGEKAEGSLSFQKQGTGAESGEGTSPSDRVAVGSEAGGDTRRGGGVGSVYHEGTESVDDGVLRQEAEVGPWGTTHTGSSSENGEEEQERAEEDAETDDASGRSHVNTKTVDMTLGTSI